MKKTLTFLFFSLVLGVSAQGLINGDFEQTATAVLPNVATSSPGWDLGLYTMETNQPFAGTQSAKLSTIFDPVTNTLISWGSDTIPGLLTQAVSGNWTNIGAMNLTYAYKQQIQNGDTALVYAQFADTLTADPNDDVVLYQAFNIYTGSSATWNNESLSFQQIPGATGTANQLLIIATSSMSAVFGTGNGTPGSTIYLDNFAVSGMNNLAVNSKLFTHVYPNPTTGILNIEVSEGFESVEVYNLNGKLELRSFDNVLDLNELPSGMYFYVITASGQKINGKIHKI